MLDLDDIGGVATQPDSDSVRVDEEVVGLADGKHRQLLQLGSRIPLMLAVNHPTGLVGEFRRQPANRWVGRDPYRSALGPVLSVVSSSASRNPILRNGHVLDSLML